MANEAAWTAETTVAKCGAPTSQAAITIDGEAATLTTYAGAQACFGLSQQWATVIHGGWAWNIVWLDNQGSESADAFFFKQILATFRFGEVPLDATDDRGQRTPACEQSDPIHQRWPPRRGTRRNVR